MRRIVPCQGVQSEEPFSSQQAAIIFYLDAAYHGLRDEHERSGSRFACKREARKALCCFFLVRFLSVFFENENEKQK